MNIYIYICNLCNRYIDVDCYQLLHLHVTNTKRSIATLSTWTEFQHVNKHSFNNSENLLSFDSNLFKKLKCNYWIFIWWFIFSDYLPSKTIVSVFSNSFIVSDLVEFDPVFLEKGITYSYYMYFVTMYHRKYVLHFIWIKLIHFHPRMINLNGFWSMFQKLPIWFELTLNFSLPYLMI